MGCKPAACTTGDGQAGKLAPPYLLRSDSGFEAGEGGAEFGAGAVGADFDKGATPAGEGGDLVGGFFVEVKKGEDEAVVGGEGLKDLQEEGVGVFVGAGGEGLVGVPGVFGEVLFDGVEVFPMEFGASGLVSPVIAADVEGEAGGPVFQGLGGVVAGELIEQAGEGFLGEVFGVFAAGDVAADDAGDEGVEVVDEGAGGGFVTMVQPLANQGWGIGGHCRLRIGDFGMRIGRGCDRRKELASGDGVARRGLGSPVWWGLLGDGSGLVAEELGAVEAFAGVE